MRELRFNNVDQPRVMRRGLGLCQSLPVTVQPAHRIGLDNLRLLLRPEIGEFGIFLQRVFVIAQVVQLPGAGLILVQDVDAFLALDEVRQLETAFKEARG